MHSNLVDNNSLAPLKTNLKSWKSYSIIFRVLESYFPRVLFLDPFFPRVVFALLKYKKNWIGKRIWFPCWRWSICKFVLTIRRSRTNAVNISWSGFRDAWYLLSQIALKSRWFSVCWPGQLLIWLYLCLLFHSRRYFTFYSWATPLLLWFIFLYPLSFLCVKTSNLRKLSSFFYRNK